MKRIFTNNTIMTGMAIIVTIVSLSISIHWQDVEWFQASGALVIIIGFIQSIRKYLRLGHDKFIEEQNTFDGGTFGEPSDEEIKRTKEETNDYAAYKINIWMAIIGTLIWAYGGILLRSLKLVIVSS